MDFEEKIKLEPIDDYGEEEVKPDPLLDHDYCKNPKLEELIEPKVEEPDYFEMNRPSEISQEPANFEYPDYLKLESVDDCENDEPINVPTKRNPRCSVCSIALIEENFIITMTNNRKFIVILGSVLGGKMPISMAKCSLNRSFLFICRNHFSEAITEIFKILNISDVNQMYMCSIGQRAALMATASLLCSTFTFLKLFDVLIDYCEWNESIQRKSQLIHTKSNETVYKRKISSPRAKSRHECSVCSELAIDQPHIFLLSSNRRLILMVGAVLGGKKSIEEAQIHVSGYRSTICKHHLTETIDEIFRVLNIKGFHEMQKCSMDNKKTVMNVVRSLSTVSCFTEFSKLLKSFIRKVKKQF